MKFVCPVCGYVYEGDSVPEGFKCPICGAAGEKFIKQEEGMTWASEHVVGVAKDVDPEILQGLRDNFAGECSEVGMYLAMARVAEREGYPEIAEAYKRYAYEEADHASRFRAFAFLARSILPAHAPHSASARIIRFFLVLSVTTSPSSSAKRDAWSASS